MQVGIDFDGTVIRYAICAKQIGGDGHTIITTETLEGAKHELQIILNRAKKKKRPTDIKYWIFNYPRSKDRWIVGNCNPS